MSRIERVKDLPDLNWSVQGAKELALSGTDVIKQTDVIWRIGDAAVCGFIYLSLVNPPWLWFILADKIHLSDLIDLRRLCERIPKGTLTAVEEGFKEGVKFATLYGFEKTEETAERNEVVYNIYRRK